MIKKRNENVTDLLSYMESKHQSVENFLHNTKSYDIVHAKECAEMIKTAVKEKKKIYIVGDYDVDGISSTSILHVSIMRLGAMPEIRIPKRISEGYGINEKICDEVENNSLVITVDNGIAAHEAIKKLKAKGCTVVITDHHLPVMVDEKMDLPQADIICNPHVYKGEFDGYCGAGVALYIAKNLIPTSDVCFPLLEAYACIATICDQMDLIEDNRNIVIKGLEVLNGKRGILTKGLKALLNLSGLSNKEITSESIAFGLGPMLNAPGRLYDDGASAFSLKVLLYNGEYEHAMTLAREVMEANQIRKDKVKKALETVEIIDFSEENVIVVKLHNIAEGILGLISSSLVEKYNVSAYVLTDTEDGLLKGSARGVNNDNIKEKLDNCASFLEKHGGHEGAAGLLLKEENYADFKKAMKKAYKDYKKDENIFYDFEICSENAMSLIMELKKFEPFGKGNELPMVKVEPVEENVSFIGKTHSTVKIKTKGLDIIGFNLADNYNEKEDVTYIGQLRENEFNGIITPQLIVSGF